jgi:limonene 1,2-monooxygenase
VEALDIIEALYATTGHINYDGKFWNLDHRRIQVRPHQEHPQFAIAGMSGVHNFAMCGERGYAALSIYFTPVHIDANPGWPDLVAQGTALAAAAEQAGRDPAQARRDWRICREVYVSDSKDTAMAEIRESLKQSYDYLFKIGLAPLMKRDESMPDAEVTFDWMVENIPWIIGSPAECVAQVRGLEEEVGGFGTLLFNSREWVTTDRWNRSLELFARYVSPHFRERDDQRFRTELADDALGG